MGCTIRQEYNCCCSLKTGSLIATGCLCIITIAFLFAFLPVMNIVFSSVDVFVTEHPDEVLKQFQAHSAQLDSDTLIPRLVYSVLYLLVVTLLAVGVSKNSNAFLIPWMIFMGLHCVAGTAASIAMLVFIIIIFVNVIAKLVFTIIFFLTLLVTAIWWYFFLCIWSYYTDIKEEQLLATKNTTRQTAV